MASSDSSGLRDDAIDEVDRLTLKIEALGGAYAQAVETQGDNAFAVMDDLLDPKVSLTTAFREVLAFWVETVRVPGDFLRNVCATITDPPDAAGPSSGLDGGDLRFFVPRLAEATDPVATGIPVAQVDKIKIVRPSKNGIPDQNIYISVSSNGKVVQVALVGLDTLKDLANTGDECSATLKIQGSGTLQI